MRDGYGGQGREKAEAKGSEPRQHGNVEGKEPLVIVCVFLAGLYPRCVPWGAGRRKPWRRLRVIIVCSIEEVLFHPPSRFVYFVHAFELASLSNIRCLDAHQVKNIRIEL